MLDIVHIHSIYRSMPDDFADCLVTNSRMAARAITRRYDTYLRPHGLTSAQLALLGALRAMPDATVSEIAAARGFERTTLTRNLDRLTAMGLVAAGDTRHGNTRISIITARGNGLIEKLLPLWRQAQAEIKSELSSEGFDSSLNVLKRLAKV